MPQRLIIPPSERAVNAPRLNPNRKSSSGPSTGSSPWRDSSFQVSPFW